MVGEILHLLASKVAAKIALASVALVLFKQIFHILEFKGAPEIERSDVLCFFLFSPRPFLYHLHLRLISVCWYFLISVFSAVEKKKIIHLLLFLYIEQFFLIKLI